MNRPTVSDTWYLLSTALFLLRLYKSPYLPHNVELQVKPILLEASPRSRLFECISRSLRRLPIDGDTWHIILTLDRVDTGHLINCAGYVTVYGVVRYIYIHLEDSQFNYLA
jgi:hypothetical protein